MSEAIVKRTANDTELVEHYVHASKGDKTRAFLLALDAGFDFVRICGAFGDAGLKIAFQCLLKGWLDRGQITDAGRAYVQNGSDA